MVTVTRIEYAPVIQNTEFDFLMRTEFNIS